MPNTRKSDQLESFDRDKAEVLADRAAWLRTDLANGETGFAMASANSASHVRNLYA
jgi:hypothetical protein